MERCHNGRPIKKMQKIPRRHLTGPVSTQNDHEGFTISDLCALHTSDNAQRHHSKEHPRREFDAKDWRVGLPATKSVGRKEETELKTHGIPAPFPTLLMAEGTLMSLSIALSPTGLINIVPPFECEPGGRSSLSVDQEAIDHICHCPVFGELTDRVQIHLESYKFLKRTIDIYMFEFVKLTTKSNNSNSSQ